MQKFKSRSYAYIPFQSTMIDMFRICVPELDQSPLDSTLVPVSKQARIQDFLKGGGVLLIPPHPPGSATAKKPDFCLSLLVWCISN